jgi:hypothetical protein
VLTVAIVGHGASVEGAGLGAAIDEADLVLRMHDCWWQDNAEDWGCRWTHGVLPGPWKGAWERTRKGAPESRWWCYRLNGEACPEVLAGVQVRAFDLAWTKAQLLRPGMARAAPTRGLAAALMAMVAAQGSLTPQALRLRLVGFDRMRSGANDGVPYTRVQADAVPAIAVENAAPPVGCINGPHHFAAERALLLSEAERYGTRLEFLP